MIRRGKALVAGLLLASVPACVRTHGSLRPDAVVEQPPTPVPAQVVASKAPPSLPPLLPPPGLVPKPPVEQARLAASGEDSRVQPARLVPPNEPGPLPEKSRPPEEPPLLAALRCYLDGRPAEAVVLLERYDKANLEILLTVLPLSSQLTRKSLAKANPQEIAAVLAQLQSLMVPLRTRAPLVIEKLCFCRHIRRFGDYEPLPAEHPFRPGEHVELYVELQNFTSELRGGQYVTRLASTVEIHDFQGRCVWRQEFKDREEPDTSRTPRHDFFASCLFALPVELRPASYTLWITVTDEPTGRAMSKSLDFRVTTLPGRKT